ncbi:MAG: outer membrane beta-barrel protein [Pseudomonadota bacterium]|nr:outer membrane beta-barrel protein [Pseudomonadota bacterium]
MILAAAATVAATLVASPAWSQNFSGPRVEGRIGWDGTGISIKDQRDFGGRGTFGGGSHASDLSFGGEAGFDIQSGNIVFGGYAGADLSEVEETFGSRGVTFETGRNFTAGARAGFAVTPNVLVFAKAGYSNGRLKPQFQAGANRTQFADFSRDRDGIHAGAGFEFSVTPNVYAKLDYTHTRYKTFDISDDLELRFNRNQVMGSIGLRF